MCFEQGFFFTKFAVNYFGIENFIEMSKKSLNNLKMTCYDDDTVEFCTCYELTRFRSPTRIG